MEAMLVLVWLSSLTMMMMRSSDAASAKIITARSGEAVLLSSDLQETDLEAGQDFRWTHPRLVVSMKKDDTCHHKQCELLKNGSLRFSRVQPADSGNYSLRVFSKSGFLQSTKVFLLRVEDGSSSSSSSSSSVVVSVLICCLLLLLLPIIFFILMRRRRRSQTTKTNTGHLEENVYVVMHGNHGKERKDAKKEEKEEESHYVDCNRVVSMKTPVTQQMSVDEEDIYV